MHFRKKRKEREKERKRGGGGREYTFRATCRSGHFLKMVLGAGEFTQKKVSELYARLFTVGDVLLQSDHFLKGEGEREGTRK